eukprot:CAMPEP_0172513110 /NCGR_PEP_ID=MMETSP1066-20121228/249778_1 /TAXON_ID=671091 /ORGANISM="Coscinodiscus wailesii, Strain CCMP2513" /LENGTH=274 /DNA_ID=CAMNT_0013293217 /DNA_START=109 /DNA_END=930 /DNA_ORIENTATION=-
MCCWILFLIYAVASTESHNHSNLRANHRHHEQKRTLVYNSTNGQNETTPYLMTASTNEKKYLNVGDFLSSTIGLKKARALQQRRKKTISVNTDNIFATNRQCKDAFTNQNVVTNIRSGSKNILKLRGVQLSEGFEGIDQIDSHGTISMSDILSGGRAKNPLTLKPSFNPRENLYVTKKCGTNKCRLEVQGRGPGGFKGPGAVSILFHKDQSSVNISFGSDGANIAVMKFYKRNGQLIKRLKVDIGHTNKYSFGRREQKDIAGIAIHPSGESLKW